MEEEPLMAAPNLEAEKTDFIIQKQSSADWYSEFSENGKESAEKKSAEKKSGRPTEKRTEKKKPAEKTSTEKPADNAQTDDFDLSDITHNPVEQDREDIIAAAEAAAYTEENR
jgi:ribonuclease-3